MGKFINCIICGKLIWVTPSGEKRNRHFCSNSCHAKYKCENGKHPTLGKKHSEETKKKMSLSANGLVGATKRWKDHVAKPRKPKQNLWMGTHDPLLQLQKKRFRNQRYKANKKGALGSHTFEEWQLLKLYYQNMCLCCKKQEPEIKLTEDHIFPLSMGGNDNIDNIQPLCVVCNTRKHVKTISYLPSNHDFGLICAEKVQVNY